MNAVEDETCQREEIESSNKIEERNDWNAVEVKDEVEMKMKMRFEDEGHPKVDDSIEGLLVGYVVSIDDLELELGWSVQMGEIRLWAISSGSLSLRME